MPRKARPQRTDLTLPKVTVPGQDYGKQQAQMNAMQAVPMASQAQPMSQPAAPTQQAAPEAPPSVPPPKFSQLKYLHPTEHPDLPMTHGLPIGPGAGPEAMGQFASAHASLSATMESLAHGPYGTPELTQVAQLIQQAGL